MKLSIISLLGALVVGLMLLPNMVYALKHKGIRNKCQKKWMNLLEQVGRYSCIALMVLPIGKGEFGFSSVSDFLFYMAANAVLLITYWAGWFQYAKYPDREHALPLVLVPSCTFLFSGMALNHWLLMGAAVVFAVGHLLVTLENHKETGGE